MGINISGRTGWSSIPNSIGRSKLPHPTVHLLVNLLSHAEGFNATYSVITQQTGMSSKTIAAALDNLKKLGLISVTKIEGKSGKFDSNDYDFHADRLWQLTPELVDERLRGKATAVEGKDGDDDRFPGESRTAVEGKAAPLYEGKTKKTNLKTPNLEDHPPLPPKGAGDASAAEGAQSSILDPFEEWWKHVNKKQSKGDARKAFNAALKKADLQTLINGIHRSQAQWQREKRHRSKTPHPATWLRAEAWLDEIPDAPDSQPSAGSKAGVPDYDLDHITALMKGNHNG